MIGSVAKTMQYSVRQGRRQVEDGRPDHTEKIGSMERKLRRRNGGDHIQNCLSNVACCRYNERIVSFLKKKNVCISDRVCFYLFTIRSIFVI